MKINIVERFFALLLLNILNIRVLCCNISVLNPCVKVQVR